MGADTSNDVHRNSKIQSVSPQVTWQKIVG